MQAASVVSFAKTASLVFALGLLTLSYNVCDFAFLQLSPPHGPFVSAKFRRSMGGMRRSSIQQRKPQVPSSKRAECGSTSTAPGINPVSSSVRKSHPKSKGDPKCLASAESDLNTRRKKGTRTVPPIICKHTDKLSPGVAAVGLPHDRSVSYSNSYCSDELISPESNSLEAQPPESLSDSESSSGSYPGMPVIVKKSGLRRLQEVKVDLLTSDATDFYLSGDHHHPQAPKSSEAKMELSRFVPDRKKIYLKYNRIKHRVNFYADERSPFADDDDNDNGPDNGPDNHSATDEHMAESETNPRFIGSMCGDEFDQTFRKKIDFFTRLGFKRFLKVTFLSTDKEYNSMCCCCLFRKYGYWRAVKYIRYAMDFGLEAKWRSMYNDYVGSQNFYMTKSLDMEGWGTEYDTEAGGSNEKHSSNMSIDDQWSPGYDTEGAGYNRKGLGVAAPGATNSFLQLTSCASEINELLGSPHKIGANNSDESPELKKALKEHRDLIEGSDKTTHRLPEGRLSCDPSPSPPAPRVNLLETFTSSSAANTVTNIGRPRSVEPEALTDAQARRSIGGQSQTQERPCYSGTASTRLPSDSTGSNILTDRLSSLRHSIGGHEISRPSTAPIVQVHDHLTQQAGSLPPYSRLGGVWGNGCGAGVGDHVQNPNPSKTRTRSRHRSASPSVLRHSLGLGKEETSFASPKKPVDIKSEDPQNPQTRTPSESLRLDDNAGTQTDGRSTKSIRPLKTESTPHAHSENPNADGCNSDCDDSDEHDNGCDTDQKNSSCKLPLVTGRHIPTLSFKHMLGFKTVFYDWRYKNLLGLHKEGTPVTLNKYEIPLISFLYKRAYKIISLYQDFRISNPSQAT